MLKIKIFCVVLLISCPLHRASIAHCTALVSLNLHQYHNTTLNFGAEKFELRDNTLKVEKHQFDNTPTHQLNNHTTLLLLLRRLTAQIYLVAARGLDQIDDRVAGAHAAAAAAVRADRLATGEGGRRARQSNANWKEMRSGS